MNRIRVFIMLALAVTVGGVFAFATYRYTQRPEPAKVDAIPTRPVVIAVTNLDLSAVCPRAGTFHVHSFMPPLQRGGWSAAVHVWPVRRTCP